MHKIRADEVVHKVLVGKKCYDGDAQPSLVIWKWVNARGCYGYASGE